MDRWALCLIPFFFLPKRNQKKSPAVLILNFRIQTQLKSVLNFIHISTIQDQNYFMFFLVFMYREILTDFFFFFFILEFPFVHFFRGHFYMMYLYTGQNIFDLIIFFCLSCTGLVMMFSLAVCFLR